MAVALRFKLARAVKSTAPPPIPLAKAWGSVYSPTPNKPLIDLSQGVPGIPPPPDLLHAIGETSKNPTFCGYGPMNGDLPMRKALVEEMKVVYGSDADIQHEDCSLTGGCNMSFLAVAMALAEPSDEVIIPLPWMSLQMLGIQVVPLPCLASRGFLPSASDCANLITPRTKAIVLVTPNNPTGAIYSPEVLASFASLAQERGIALVLDETYRDLITSGPPHRLFSRVSSTIPDWKWRTNLIHLFSFSKSYCVPGHRLGAIIASPLLLDEVNTVLDCMQICPPRPIQNALHPLLPNIRPFIRATAQSLVIRQALFRSILPSNWEIGSQGAYYAFVRHPFVGISALDVSMRLAKEMGVVTLPGSFFGLSTKVEAPLGSASDAIEGGDRWIRFSVANVDEENLREVGKRLEECGDVFGWATAVSG